MNVRKLLATAAAVVAVIGCSVAAAPAEANDFERRLNFEAMRNYMNQNGGYTNQYYGNVNNNRRDYRYNNGWNNGWNNNGRNWNNGRHNGWNKRRHHGRNHHHHH
ncbi:MAG: hypothetical protein WCT03_25955 [Candidatus Obscuribacterales bacterium]|jgi:opacity protein-like surface antigen